MRIIAVNYFGWTDESYDVFRKMGCEVDLVMPNEAPPRTGYEVGFCEASYVTANADLLLDSLRFVQMQTAGHNHLPSEFIAANPQITFCSGSGAYGGPISEWAVGAALQVLRRTGLFEEYRREKKWSWSGSYEARELWGCEVGILGTGDIGSACARKFKAFNCRVTGLNTNGRAVEGFDECLAVSNVNKICMRSDVIVNTLPLTAATAMLVGREQLELCKPSAVIVNVSRGGIIDEMALTEMLNADRLMGASFDCYETEPLPAESPLWDAKNFIMNPHCCGVSKELSRRYLEHYRQNLENYMAGRELTRTVTPGRGY